MNLLRIRCSATNNPTTHGLPPLTTHPTSSMLHFPKASSALYIQNLLDIVSHRHRYSQPFGEKYAYMDIRDLLVRHEKLVHLNENSKENNRPRKLSSGAAAVHKSSISDSHIDVDSALGMHRAVAQPHPPPPPPLQQQQQQPQQHQHQPQAYHHVPMNPSAGPSMIQDPRSASRTAACNLDLLSDAALATEVNHMQPMVNDMSQQHPGHVRVKSYPDSLSPFVERPREDQQVLQPSFAPPVQQNAYDDYNLFLDEFGSSSHFLPPNFDPDQQMNLWSRSPGTLQQRGGSKPPSQFPSRFGSVAPDPRDSSDMGSRMHDDQPRPPSLRISVVDHTVIKNRLEEFSSVLPSDFVFPSRHTLTRFLEGYITGFHEHLPFLHLPTLSPVEIAPELLLAMLAVGAQYRFESNRGYALWYAAKAVAMEQIRRRHSSEVHALLPTAAAYSPHSTRPSPSTTYRHSFASAQSERPTTQDTHREP